MFRPTVATIDLTSLVHNARVLKQWAGDRSFFCPMIKAEAYGHGSVQSALALEAAGFKTVGVALVEEGIKVRHGQFVGQILIFGPLEAGALVALKEYRLTPVIGRWEDLEKLEHSQQSWSLHLKFNTGMNRLGFPASDAEKLSQRVLKNKNFKLEGIATHLSHGDDGDQRQGFTAKQLEVFKNLSQYFPGVTRHCLNSSGLISHLEQPQSLREALGARPGIALYGLSSGAEPIRAELKPVLGWKTKLAFVQNVRAGQGVSYSARWVAGQDSVIGVVPLGYADGYMRALTNKSQMLWRGHRVNVVGSVCMDYTLLDLSAGAKHGAPNVGEDVVVIGEQDKRHITALDLAQLAGTISYEIVTNISARVPRVFVGA